MNPAATQLTASIFSRLSTKKVTVLALGIMIFSSPLTPLSVTLAKEPDTPPQPAPDTHAAYQERLELFLKLKKVTEERDAFEQRAYQLEQQLKAQKQHLENIRQDLISQEGFIRLSDTSLQAVKLDDTRHNETLRHALFRVAKKLSEAEKALTLLRQENTALREELAHLRRPVIGQVLSMPLLAESTNTPVTQTAPEPAKAASIQASENTDKMEGSKVEALIYHPPRKAAITNLDNPSQKGEPSVSTTRSTNLKQDIVILEKKIKQQPNEYPAYIELASRYTQQGKPQKAEQVLLNLLSHNPRFAQAYYELTLIYIKQQAPKKAGATLSTYQRLSPGDIDRIQALLQEIQSISGKGNTP